MPILPGQLKSQPESEPPPTYPDEPFLILVRPPDPRVLRDKCSTRQCNPGFPERLNGKTPEYYFQGEI